MKRASIVISILLAALWIGAAQSRRHPEAKKPAEPSLPWTYTKVIEGIDGIGHGGKEEELIRQILKSKVDFPVTEGVEEDLRKHGASDRVIAAIVQVSPPLPPDLTPKPVPTGGLSIRCAPVDCDISLNGKSSGTSERGELNLSKIPIGETVIDFSRKGFIAQQKSVQIAAGSSVSVSITLEPDYATKTEFGRQALQSMLTAIGLGKDQKQLWTLAATGSATTWDSQGKDSEWNIDFEFGPPNLLKMEARGTGGNLTLFCRGEHCEPKKKSGILGGKHSKAPATDSLTMNLMQFARCHLAAMLARLINPANHMMAASFDELAEQDQHFTVEATDVSYDVTIRPQARLGSIVVNPRSGLGAGLTLTFGSYSKIAGFQYPNHTDIKLPGEGQHGIQIRFDVIRQESNLREKDFPE